MRKQAMNFPKKRSKLSSAMGFSLFELLIVIALIAVVTAFAVISFQKSNRDFKVAGATRTLSAYLEKARIDAVRRHAGTSIDLNSNTSYTVNIDFDGTGTPDTRTITLPEGISLGYTVPPASSILNPLHNPTTIAYDWRGRTSAVLLTLSDSTSDVASRTVMVGPVGDISTDTAVTGPVTAPTPQDLTVSPTAGIKSMQ